jgi:hypothetical protein
MSPFEEAEVIKLGPSDETPEFRVLNVTGG